MAFNGNNAAMNPEVSINTLDHKSGTAAVAGPAALALIGAGAMGSALLKGWLAANVIDPRRSLVVEPAADWPAQAMALRAGIALSSDARGLFASGKTQVSSFDAVVIAVKPQGADEALAPWTQLARDVERRPVFLSIMAGRSVASIRKVLGPDARVARAMPNLAAAVGAGVTGLWTPDAFDAPARAICARLMAAVGEVVPVPSEGDLDAVTAISGSGPAYFFLVAEALEEAGVALGLSPEAARILARRTAQGSGAMMAADARSAGDLRVAVTSPGGTTAAALGVLDGDAAELRNLMKKATKAALDRARALTE